MNCTSKILSLTLLVSAAACVADATTTVSPYLSFRSQSQDVARQMVGGVGHVYKADMDKHYAVFSFTPEYTRSFHGKEIAQSLFGCNYLQDCLTLKITGSAVATRTDKDLLANWFYLPYNYEGSVSFEPVVQNFNADLSFYWGMDEWVQGMFFRIHAPITWTKFDLGAKFSTTVPGATTGYLEEAETFFCEQGIGEGTGLTFRPLNCARFCGCSCDDNKTKTRLADIQADLGWNFLLDEDYHLGLFARVVAPTGNKVKGEWLFEPMVGNGHHWELGGGLTGSAILWRNAEESKHFGFYVDADITHLFNAHQNRVFDLKNKPLSRYMTAIKIVDGIATAEFAPIANLTSCKMDVNVAVQADIAAMFNYTCKNWSYDLGYNFWARSCEKFDCDSDCDDSCDDCDACCGQCIIKNGVETWGIDNINNLTTANNATISSVGTIDIDPVSIKDSDIDYDGAKTKGMSHKVFAHINYSWMDREVVPFVGLGGYAEFGHHDSCCDDCNTSCSTSCDDDCSCCKNIALSQWGLWLKGGVSF